MFDGTSSHDLQVVLDPKLVENIDVNVGASVSVNGSIHQSLGKGQTVEIQAKGFSLVGHCDSEYPLQKKEHSDEFLRENAHLRARTTSFASMMRIRNTAAHGLHAHLQERGFIEVNAPIIVSGDCEGAGEMFKVIADNSENAPPFFGSDAFLTVSGQLHGEALACAMSKVYVFGPTFRAEKHSKTSVHLAEFWMFEPEIAFSDMRDLTELAESSIKHSASVVLKKNSTDIELIGKKSVEELERLISIPFVQMSYTEAIAVLEKCGASFSYPVAWGMDLQREHERYLCERYSNGVPVFVTDYPKTIKPFYAKQSVNISECVQAVDLLVPGIGELVGGSVREDSYDVLLNNLLERKMDAKQYEWYLDLRRYGSVPHSGFGLGFERFVQCLTGISNIRDVLPFPRSSNSIKY